MAEVCQTLYATPEVPRGPVPSSAGTRLGPFLRGNFMHLAVLWRNFCFLGPSTALSCSYAKGCRSFRARPGMKSTLARLIHSSFRAKHTMSVADMQTSCNPQMAYRGIFRFADCSSVVNPSAVHDTSICQHAAGYYDCSLVPGTAHWSSTWEADRHQDCSLNMHSENDKSGFTT